MSDVIRRMRDLSVSQQPVHPVVNGGELRFTLEININMFRRKLSALDYHNPEGFDNKGKKQCEGAPKCDSVIFDVEPDNVRAKLRSRH